MRRVKLFRIGRSQALRLPRGFRFEGALEVSIRREGKAVILEPVEKSSRKRSWKSWEAPGDDLLPGRGRPPGPTERDLDLD